MNAQYFTCGNKTIEINKTYIMGIVNVTPDSFYGGSRADGLDDALRRCLAVVERGGDIIDIGGESTRPGSTPVSADEELARVIPVVERLVSETDALISVDTHKWQVAKAAVAAGAHIINDVDGFLDDDMLAVAASCSVGLVAMHPGYHEYPDGVFASVRDYFADVIARMTAAGIDCSRICLDPGIGFRKNPQQNCELIARTGELLVDGTTYLIGASRKRFVGGYTDTPDAADRLVGTLAAHTVAQFLGADIIRAHDVAEAVQAAKMCDALRAQRKA